jgi:hypothetical protein
MIKLKIFTIIVASLAFSISAYSKGNTPLSVCELFKNSKSKTAYLIDSKYKMNKGPVNLGQVSISEKLNLEGSIVSTNYFVIASPSIEPQNIESNILTTKLFKTKSICKDFNMYKVFMGWSFPKKITTPYKFKTELPILAVVDQDGYEGEINAYNFNPMVIGELIIIEVCEFRVN